jgi:hypothetical protein
MSSQNPTSTPANTAVNITFPTSRTDGTPLALSEIATLTVSKAVGAAAASVVLTQSGPFQSPTFQFTDSSPDFGSTDAYSVTVTDVEGNVSGPGTGSVAVPPSTLAPPSAPTISVAFNPATTAQAGDAQAAPGAQPSA